MRFSDLFRLLKPYKSPHRKMGFRPQLESLEDRLVPTITGIYVGNIQINNETRWGIRLNTDGGNDRVTFWDNGKGSGKGGVGNVSGLVVDNYTRILDPMNKSLTVALDNNHIDVIQVYDSGGHNNVYYQGETTTPVRYVDFHGGPQNDEFYATMEQGLGASQMIRFTADGGEGDDTLKLIVQATLQQKSNLGAGFEGANGFDDVSVDAWTYSPTIEPGAMLWANLSGYRYGQLSSDNNGNLVSYWYQGRMDGTLLFNLMGSGGKDWVSANLFFFDGSQGWLGDGTSTGARISGGDSRDDMQYIVQGPNSAVHYQNDVFKSSTKVDFPRVIDGGSGDDTLTLAQSPAPGFALYTPNISGIDHTKWV